jgi:hypothetical protein
MTRKRSGPATTPGRSQESKVTTTDTPSLGQTSDKDADVLQLRGPGWAEYQEARQRLHEENARRRARRGGR